MGCDLKGEGSSGGGHQRKVDGGGDVMYGAHQFNRLIVKLWRLWPGGAVSGRERGWWKDWVEVLRTLYDG